MSSRQKAAEAAPDPIEPEVAEAPPANWRFIGEHQLVYPHIPVTVGTGDVIAHDGPPAPDGRWEPTDAEVTRRPDNAPQEG